MLASAPCPTDRQRHTSVAEAGTGKVTREAVVSDKVLQRHRASGPRWERAISGRFNRGGGGATETSDSAGKEPFCGRHSVPNVRSAGCA